MTVLLTVHCRTGPAGGMGAMVAMIEVVALDYSTLHTSRQGEAKLYTCTLRQCACM